MKFFSDLTLLDVLAFSWFVLLWAGFALAVDRSSWRAKSLSAIMNTHRLRWMQRLVERENRVGDTTLVSNLMRSISFFASTSMLVLGGLLAWLGNVDRSYEVMRELPFIVDTSKEVYELKVMTLFVVFVYAFFKFTWSLRQFNYCCILIGGAPHSGHAEDVRMTFVKQAARINELGGRSFNEGLRGYYFALGLLGWFLHPLTLMAGTAAVIAVLWRREFHSKTLRAVTAANVAAI